MAASSCRSAHLGGDGSPYRFLGGGESPLGNCKEGLGNAKVAQQVGQPRLPVATLGIPRKEQSSPQTSFHSLPSTGTSLLLAWWGGEENDGQGQVTQEGTDHSTSLSLLLRYTRDNQRCASYRPLQSPSPQIFLLKFESRRFPFPEVAPIQVIGRQPRHVPPRQRIRTSNSLSGSRFSPGLAFGAISTSTEESRNR